MTVRSILKSDHTTSDNPILFITVQCLIDIDTSNSTIESIQSANPKKWVQETIVFEATSVDTWIQIIANAVNDPLYIDAISVVSCT